MLEQLIHNGIVITKIPVPEQLELGIRGQRVDLTHRQIEMAMAWAKKQGTPYVEDSVFVRNFMQDFSAELGLKPALTVEEVDFGPAIQIVLAERAVKEQLTKEERKALAAQRKEKREQLKEQYGYAIVDEALVELGSYATEPSGIFMGRGRHPLRGRWKEGPEQSDITLNLSPDAPHPDGDWGEIIWQPESLWVARWKDKLSGKLKYVWLSDTAPIKQEREAAKFDKAVELAENLARVQTRIQRDLTDDDKKRRTIATVCYLIDALCLRVGDEKDADEADTVGATTLRPEHVTLLPDGEAEFNFLGKDSVQWNKTITLPPVVYQNLEVLIQEARPSRSASARNKPQIFPGISSSTINTYLSEILPGLTAKVFRTHHATRVVSESLEGSGVEASDPEYEKWGAFAMANLEAAILCNHYKKGPDNWRERRQRAADQLQKKKDRVATYREKVRQTKEALKALRQEAKEKRAAAKTREQEKKVKARYDKRIATAKKRVETAEGQLERARAALGKAQTKDRVTAKKRTWNVNTSLKSYIDPRVPYRWGQRVEYDVLENYYPKGLRGKLSWARDPEPADNPTESDEE